MVQQAKLTTVWPFDGLPVNEAETIAASAELLRFEPGATLAVQGEVADQIYLLHSGSVQILVRYPGIGDLLVARLEGSGNLVGWSALRSPGRYAGTVRAESECEVTAIQSSAISELCERKPVIGAALLLRVAATVASRLDGTLDLLLEGHYQEGSDERD